MDDARIAITRDEAAALLPRRAGLAVAQPLGRAARPGAPTPCSWRPALAAAPRGGVRDRDAVTRSGGEAAAIVSVSRIWRASSRAMSVPLGLRQVEIDREDGQRRQAGARPEHLEIVRHRRGEQAMTARSASVVAVCASMLVTSETMRQGMSACRRASSTGAWKAQPSQPIETGSGRCGRRRRRARRPRELFGKKAFPVGPAADLGGQGEVDAFPPGASR